MHREKLIPRTRTRRTQLLQQENIRRELTVLCRADRSTVDAYPPLRTINGLVHPSLEKSDLAVLSVKLRHLFQRGLKRGAICRIVDADLVAE